MNKGVLFLNFILGTSKSFSNKSSIAVLIIYSSFIILYWNFLNRFLMVGKNPIMWYYFHQIKWTISCDFCIIISSLKSLVFKTVLQSSTNWEVCSIFHHIVESLNIIGLFVFILFRRHCFGMQSLSNCAPYYTSLLYFNLGIHI